MEIKIEIPLRNRHIKERIKIDEKSFKEDLILFIDKLENQGIEDSHLIDKLISYGINKIQFEEMCKNIRIIASYDENKKHIDFPYEAWIDRLLEFYVYEEE